MKYFEKFPTLRKEQILLDNVSSLQLPGQVINAVEELINSENINVGKGNSVESFRRVKEVTKIKERIATFINARSEREIFFSCSATQSMWILSLVLMPHFEDNDEIILSMEDHESTISPWINLVKVFGKLGRNIRIKNYSYKENGEIDIDQVNQLITSKTKLFIATQIHNIYGTKNENDIALIKERMSKDAIVIVDISESVGRTNVSVQSLNADFALFSGSKIFGISGTGVIYCNEKIVEKYEIEKLVQGSLNYLSIYSLGVALEFFTNLKPDKVYAELSKLTKYTVESLRKIKGIEFSKGIGNCNINCSPGYGIVSFKLQNISASEVGFILADEDIIVRAGDLCNSDKDFVRIGLHLYNTREDIDRLVSVIEKILS